MPVFDEYLSLESVEKVIDVRRITGWRKLKDYELLKMVHQLATGDVNELPYLFLTRDTYLLLDERCSLYIDERLKVFVFNRQIFTWQPKGIKPQSLGKASAIVMKKVVISIWPHIIEQLAT